MIKTQLGRHCTVQSSKRVFAREYVARGVPFFRSKDVIDKALGSFVNFDLFISQERFEELNRKTGSPQNGDLLVNSVGNRTGQTYVVEDEGDFYFKDGNILWLNKFSGLDPHWLSYWTRSAVGQNALASIMIGSAQKALTIDGVRKLWIQLPSLDVQKETAGLLRALDDKIEVNRRMNETLEAMARAVFRDWFVDFGPTRRQMAGASDPNTILGGLIQNPEEVNRLAALFPNALGDNGLPEGWELGTLGDYAVEIKDTVKPSEIDPSTPYIGLEHMPRRSIALSDWEPASKVTSNKARFAKGQILFGKLRPYFHKTGVAPLTGICSTDIVVIDSSKDSFRSFVTLCVSMKEFVDFTDQTSTGTKMPRTKWATMKGFVVAKAPNEVLDAFDVFAFPLIEKLTASISENQTLAATRNLLLPKLMSGEIRLTGNADG